MNDRPGESVGAATYERDGIDALTILENFKVQVRSGRTARIAHQGNHLTLLDLISDFDEVFLIVRIPS